MLNTCIADANVELKTAWKLLPVSGVNSYMTWSRVATPFPPRKTRKRRVCWPSETMYNLGLDDSPTLRVQMMNVDFDCTVDAQAATY